MTKKRNMLDGLSAIACGGIAFYLSISYWEFTWIALGLLCYYSLNHSAKLSFVTGFFAFLLGTANPEAVLPFWVYWPLLVGNAVAFAGVLSIFSLVAARRKNEYESFVFALGLTAEEFIVSLLSPQGTVSSLAYTQVDNLPIIQVAAVTGIWGITFVMALTAAALAAAVQYPSRRRLKVNLFPIAILLAVVLFGFCRLAAPLTGEKAKVGIAAVSINLERYLAVAAQRDQQAVDAVVQQYRQNADFLAQSGAELVLLPEKIVTLDNREILQDFSDSARKNHISLILGAASREENQIYNSAYLFSQTGDEVLQYHKQHLQTTYESRFSPGSRLAKTDGVGLAICKDMDFTEPSLEYSRQGTKILFVPALDFHEDGWSHARIAIMRGVEGDFAVARAGQWGWLTVSDSRGRVVGKVSCDEHPEGATLIQEVSVGEGKSLYSKVGNSFGWLCVVLFAVFVKISGRP